MQEVLVDNVGKRTRVNSAERTTSATRLLACAAYIPMQLLRGDEAPLDVKPAKTLVY